MTVQSQKYLLTLKEQKAAIQVYLLWGRKCSGASHKQQNLQIYQNQSTTCSVWIYNWIRKHQGVFLKRIRIVTVTCISYTVHLISSSQNTLKNTNIRITHLYTDKAQTERSSDFHKSNLGHKWEQNSDLTHPGTLLPFS